MFRGFPLRKFLPRPTTSRPARPSQRAGPRYRPRLEQFENRLTPATHVWSGAVDDLWDNPGNWSQWGVPYGDDQAVVVFPAAGARFNSVHNRVTLNVTIRELRFEGGGYHLIGGGFAIVPLPGAASVTSLAGNNRIGLVSMVFPTAGDHIFNVAEGASLDVSSFLNAESPGTDSAELVKTGRGTLTLLPNFPNKPNVTEAPTRLIEGKLVVGVNGTLGSALLRLEGGTLVSAEGANIHLENPVFVGQPSTVEGSFGLTFAGTVGIGRSASLLVLNDFDDSNEVIFRDEVYGEGELRKDGEGRLFLNHASTYTGGTSIQNGEVIVGNDTALGFGIVHLNGGTLQKAINTPVTMPNILEVTGGTILNAPVFPDDSPFIFNGPVEIMADSVLTVNNEDSGGVAGRAAVIFAGAIFGDGGLTKIGNGFTTLGDANPNTYAGTTTVASGRLFLGKPPGGNAIVGPLKIGDSEGAPNTAVVELTNHDQIRLTSEITINSDGQLKFGIFSDDTQDAQGENFSNVVGIDPPTWTVHSSGSKTFNGVISGPLILVKEGAGTWTLNGNNTFDGGTTLNGGTLIVNGAIGDVTVNAGATLVVNGSVGAVTVNAGGTLAGTGTTGPVTLAPGATISPGGAGPGIQHFQDLAFAEGASFVVQLNGPEPGTGYDQLDVTGTVSLNGATLNATLGYSPAPGQAFVLIKNDGTDAVTGTFAGLPQSAFLMLDGVAFNIFYNGGDGNDVVLVNNQPPEITAHTNDAGAAGEGAPITVSGSFTDPDALDTHTVQFDWGDGTTSMGTVTEGGGAGTFAGTHTYAQAGVYTVTITLTDSAAGSDTASETVFAPGAAIQEVGERQVLFVIGTHGDDLAAVAQALDLVTVTGSFLSGLLHTHTFDADDFDEIRVVLRDGNDTATLAGLVTDPALIDGGAGNDTLTAATNLGMAGVVLLGSDGDDLITGSNGRDVLIGGRGKDVLVALEGNDLLVGGYTTYETDVADAAVLTSQEALLSILAEWNSDRSFAARRANIAGTGSGPRLNGDNFLQSGVTVFDDGESDLMTGGLSADWFLASNNDLALDNLPLLGDVKSS